MRPCPRCGIPRRVNESRRATLCRDCKSTLTAEERALWEAEKEAAHA